MVIIRKPKIEKRPQQVYMGIRSLAPFISMSKTNPDVEPRKSRRHIEVAIKLAEK